MKPLFAFIVGIVLTVFAYGSLRCAHAGEPLKRTIQPRRSFLGVIAAALACACPRALWAKPQEESKALEISDEAMAIFGTPVFRRCRTDDKYRRELNAQMRRVFGQREVSELIWQMIVDDDARILHQPLRRKAVRAHLRLPN